MVANVLESNINFEKEMKIFFMFIQKWKFGTDCVLFWIKNDSIPMCLKA